MGHLLADHPAHLDRRDARRRRGSAARLRRHDGDGEDRRGEDRRGTTGVTGTGPMDIRATLEALCDAFNAHDLDRIMAFFADDCVLEMPRGSKPWGSRFEGRKNVRAALAT